MRFFSRNSFCRSCSFVLRRGVSLELCSVKNGFIMSIDTTKSTASYLSIVSGTDGGDSLSFVCATRYAFVVQQFQSALCHSKKKKENAEKTKLCFKKIPQESSALKIQPFPRALETPSGGVSERHRRESSAELPPVRGAAQVGL